MKSKFSLSTLVLLGAIFFSALPAVAQTYSHTFVVKGKDGGKYRIRAFLRAAQGSKPQSVPVEPAKVSQAEQKANSTH